MAISTLTKLTTIILNSYRYWEFNKIINVFSKEYGLISIKALGVDKLTSKNKFALDLFCLSDLEVFINPSSLHRLKKAFLIKGNNYCFHNYFIYLIFSLYHEILKKNSVIKNKEILFQLWKSVIIDEGKNIFTKTDCFLIQNLINQGAKLDLNYCYRCLQPKKIKSFSFQDFGFICKYCFQKKDPILKYSFLKLLLIFQNAKTINDLQEINDFEYEQDLKIIFYFLLYYYQTQLGFFLISYQEIKKHSLFLTIEKEIIKKIKYKQ